LPKSRHLGTIAQLCRAVSSQLRHISTVGKNLLSSNISSTCPHNMVNFGPLAAEIGLVVWGTPANFNGFRILAALLHGTLVVGISQTLRRGTEGATYIRQGGHHVGHWPTFLVWLAVQIIRSTPLSRLNNIRGGNVRLSVRTSVCPSTKSMSNFNEIWYVYRGR